jgi:integrase
MPKRVTRLLTDVQLKNWVKAGRPIAKSDGDGLTFTLPAAGTAAWVLRYRVGSRQRELTLGRYPDLDLSNARKQAAIKRAEVQQGRDPATERRMKKTFLAQSWTVRQLVADYREKILPDLSKSTQRSYGRNLRRLTAKIGLLWVHDVEPADVVTLIEGSGLPWVEANMLLVATRVLFRHATGKKLIPRSPCAGVEMSSIKGKRPPIRKRLMLSEAELRLLLDGRMRRENALAIRVLLATAVRSAELYQATWSQFNLDAGIWDIPASKTGPGISVPLAPAVIDWLKELHELAAGSNYVLPARANARLVRHGGDTHINPNTLGQAIDWWLDHDKPSVRRITPHDLRSTEKSHMRALGIARDITEMCLNHRLKGVEGVYDRYNYFAEASGQSG